MKSYFSIEREFDRYYQLLKTQLRDGTAFDRTSNLDDLQIAALRNFDPEKIWTNPNMKIPLESAHLTITKPGEENPHEFEKLCVDHEAIKPTYR